MLKNYLTVMALIAFPVAWLAMSKWLQQYAYRITTSWDIFAMGGAAALIVAAITIGFQAIKTASDPPAKSLKQT